MAFRSCCPHSLHLPRSVYLVQWSLYLPTDLQPHPSTQLPALPSCTTSSSHQCPTQEPSCRWINSHTPWHGLQPLPPPSLTLQSDIVSSPHLGTVLLHTDPLPPSTPSAVAPVSLGACCFLCQAWPCVLCLLELCSKVSSASCPFRCPLL